MTIGIGIVLLAVVLVIVALLWMVVRPRRPRLVNAGRRPRGFRRRRMDAIKRAAAADIALLQGDDEVLPPKRSLIRKVGPEPPQP